jgi:hypothetical protein
MSLTIAVVWNCLTSWNGTAYIYTKPPVFIPFHWVEIEFPFPILAGFFFYYTSSSVKLGIKMNLVTFDGSFGNEVYRLVTSFD